MEYNSSYALQFCLWPFFDLIIYKKTNFLSSYSAVIGILNYFLLCIAVLVNATIGVAHCCNSWCYNCCNRWCYNWCNSWCYNCCNSWCYNCCKSWGYTAINLQYNPVLELQLQARVPLSTLKNKIKIKT